MTLIDIADALIAQSGADDADTSRLADLIWDVYGPVDQVNDIAADDAVHLVDAAR